MSMRTLAGFLAGILTLSSTVQAPVGTTLAEGSDSYDMTVTVDLAGSKKSISPYIYGINEFGNGTNIRNVTVNALRQGGNRYTGYNWETNWSNAGEDWHNSSDTNIGDITDGPASAAIKLSAECEKYKVPYKITTLQMAGYVSADKDGTVTADQTAPSDRWCEVKAKKDGELSLTPDLDDKVVYMDEYVNYLVNKIGDSTTSTGIKGYSLDNEPCLWNDTHPLLHPDEVTNKELVSKSIELAKVVKDIDPNAEIFGPAFWGMLPCMNAAESGNGFTDEEWQAVKSNYRWYIDFYLDQMKKAEEAEGKRLLDVIDVHYYAQDCSTDDAILQAARSLYDPSYVENSWLQPWAGEFFPFIPNLKKSVDTYYPGTKIAVSEYNIANISDEKNTGKSVISGLAEAEALGAFAMNDVYFATYWGSLPECPYVASAINLYTNYDGKGSSFGDTLVDTNTEDLSRSAAFAAIDGDDDSKVTVVLSNKDKTKSETATIDLSSTDTYYRSAVVYAITQDHSDIRVIEVQNGNLGNKIEVELPPLSVAQVVIRDKETDEKVYEAPDITEKSIKYNFDELDVSANGYMMIPLGDVDHLTKAVIDLDSSCSTGASWYCGGGALTFNKLVPKEGKAFWGFKSFGYSGGHQEVTIEFDGVFSDGESDDLEAEIGDTYSEFQDWWTSSANDETGADVSVKYNSITLYYVYDNGEVEPGTDPDPDDKVFYGDANDDGEISIDDAVLIMQALANPDKYGVGGTDENAMTEQGKKNADCFDPGSDLTAKDALAVQRYLLKSITELPEE